ncbi:MAG: hypothetical protein WAK96_10910 [Desulfobaccales bacterium]
MQRYWEQHPPVGDLVAAYLGYKPVGRESEAHPAKPKSSAYGSAEELMATFSASGGIVSSKQLAVSSLQLAVTAHRSLLTAHRGQDG